MAPRKKMLPEFYKKTPDDTCLKYNNNATLNKQSLDSLSILYLNINSLRNKLYDLEIFLTTLMFKPDVILLTEVRILSNEHPYYNIPNYNATFSTREPNKKKNLEVE